MDNTVSKSEFKNTLEGLKELINEKFDNQSFRLTVIEKLLNDNIVSTDRIEYRVDELEKKEGLHYAECPNNPKIRALEDGVLKNSSVRRWIIASITLTSTFLGIVVAILKMTNIL